MATLKAADSLALRANSKKLLRDGQVLCRFVSIYCDAHHRDRSRNVFIGRGKIVSLQGGLKPELCRECAEILGYGLGKLLLCPYDPKPRCKHCPTHCYAPRQRKQIREIMRFSGKWLVTHGRLDLLFKLLF